MPFFIFCHFFGHMRARPDQTHLASPNIKQFRQFVNTEPTDKYYKFASMVEKLNPDTDFSIDEKVFFGQNKAIIHAPFRSKFCIFEVARKLSLILLIFKHETIRNKKVRRCGCLIIKKYFCFFKYSFPFQIIHKAILPFSVRM